MTTETTTRTEALAFVEVHTDKTNEPFRFTFDNNYQWLTDETAPAMARLFKERSGHRAVAIRQTTTVTTTVETVVLYDSDEEAQP